VTPPAAQAWIDGIVLRETAARNILLEDLRSGKAFVAVHTAAVFSLVSDPVAVTPNTVPETLLFDVSRLALLHREFNRIVDGITMLLTANHAVVGSERHPSKEQREVLTDLASLIIDGSDFEAIAASFSAKLDSAGVLADPVARGKLFKVLSSCIGNRDDSVRKLM
jgi:hypothetical protein